MFLNSLKTWLDRSQRFRAILATGLFLFGPMSAWALPQCNISFTVVENSSNNLYIFNSTDLNNCDPGFSGISPGVQTPALGGAYVPNPNNGATYTTQSTASDDRINYTPAANFFGTQTFQVCGEPGTTTCGTVTVTVTPIITLSPTTLPAATVGTAYSQTITASGGTSPYTFTITAGSLPAGLSLSSSNGVVSGTPTAGGSFNFTVTATDSLSKTGSQAYNLTVNAPTIVVSPNFPPNQTVGQATNLTFTGSGGTGPYSFAITSGSLPAGITLGSSGVMSGTATQGGTFNFTITATDSSTGTGPFTGSHAYTLLWQSAIISTSPANIPNGAVGTSYSQTISGTGGTSPYTFQITGGALPAGLVLNSSTGVISGTPTDSGNFTVFIVATDSSTGTGPYFGGRSYSFAIAAPTISLSPATLPGGTVAVAYSQSVSGSGGTSPYAYAVTAGALPAGLSLNGSTGTIAGTSTAGGTFNFMITATDSTTGTGPFTGSQAYSVAIAAPTITLSPTTLPAATVAASYSQTITASGGTATYTFAVTSGSLPAGMTLSSAGVLSGTATAGGNFNFTVTATDSSTGTGPYTGSRAYSLTVGAPTITLSPTTLPSATIAASYSQTITASGGTATYTFAVTSGSLPAGMTLSSAGVLSGTATAGGNFNFTVTATDSSTGTGPYTGSRAYSLTVGAPTITLSPATLPAGTSGVFYSQTITASGGTATYIYAVTAGSLPNGVTLSSAGLLSGTPSANGPFNFTVTATDSSTGTGPYSGSQAYSLTIGAPTITLSPSTLPAATVAAAYNQVISASGGASPYSYAVTAGSVPAGLSLNGGTGTLSGTPTAGGTFSFTVTATDANTNTGSQAYSLTVNTPTITLSPTTLPAATVASAYSQAISASGGTASYTFTVTSGALPTGTTLSSAGVLSGTPTAGGSFNFTVTATDSSTGTGPYTGSQAYSLTIGAPTITLSPTTLPTATVASAYNQAISASGGTASYTFTITSGALPAGTTLSSAGVLSGTPTAGGSFNFTVTATDSSTGGGPYSGSQAYTLMVAPTAQTVSFTSSAPTSAMVGSTYTVSATASSGLVVTLSIDAASTPGSCTLVGSTVTFTGAGTCIIDANQAGNGSFGAAPQVQQTITVGAAPVPVSVPALDRWMLLLLGALLVLVVLAHLGAYFRRRPGRAS